MGNRVSIGDSLVLWQSGRRKWDEEPLTALDDVAGECLPETPFIVFHKHKNLTGLMSAVSPLRLLVKLKNLSPKPTA